MKEYVVPAARFFADDSTAVLRDRAKCRDAALQLISRFGIAGRSVLSVGAGAGCEEYWMQQTGCSLTIVDIDQHQTIEPRLQTLARAGSHEAKLRYVIGDAMELLRDAQSEFDVVYFSGFTPAECRRGDIQMRYTRRVDRRVQQRLARWIGGEAPTWPDDAEPFGPYEVEAMQRALRAGGLLISQSYYRGVPLSGNPHYLKCMQRQLHSLGLELLRYYTFGAPWTDVGLAVAYRGNRDDAHAFNELTDSKPELKTFHGRSEVAAGLVIHRLPG